MSVADEIKARLDIVSYVQQYVPLKRAGKTWKAPCPFHSERTPSFVVNPDTQTWRCFGSCAEGGDVISFAMKRNGWAFGEALQELGKLAGVEVKKQTPEQRQQNERFDVLRGLMHTAADAYHNALLDPKVEGQPEVLRYTQEKRGFSQSTISQFKIGYAPPGWTNMIDHLKTLGYTEAQMIEVGIAVHNEDTGRVYDRFRNRLMIPIRDERGRVIGFGARALNADDNPKYLNSPQTPLFDKSRTLFGLDAAKDAIRETETAVIVEGYMDAIQAHQAGFKNVVAQMGTAMTETQLRLLTRSAKRIVLALDSDAAGQNATRRSLETARTTLQADFSGKLSLDIRVLQIPDAKDPDDLIRETPDRWAEIVSNAIGVAEFVIDMETAALPANAPVQEREAVARSLLPILTASENNLYNHDNVQKLALRLRIPERDLLAWAAEQEQIERARKPRTAPAKPEEPPTFISSEPPPLDHDPIEPPDVYNNEDEYPNQPLKIVPAVQPVRKLGNVREAAMEVQVLRVLFRQPMTYYVVNRKLRELAGDNRPLGSGPLADWGADDFTHAETRALMQAFLQSLEQDNLEPLDYLRLEADISLQPQLDVILADELNGMKSRVRDAFGADMDRIYTHNRRVIETIDSPKEVLDKALRLRAKRLQQEREELCFLQIDAQMNGDEEADTRFQQQIILSIHAKGLIEAELQKQMSILRE